MKSESNLNNAALIGFAIPSSSKCVCDSVHGCLYLWLCVTHMIFTFSKRKSRHSNGYHELELWHIRFFLFAFMIDGFELNAELAGQHPSAVLGIYQMQINFIKAKCEHKQVSVIWLVRGH